MRNRVPVPASERPPIPDFTPVPRKYRHDGWTPERQRAFVEALADCGSVRRACAMVNMANENAYVLRRSPGAEAFRAAWDAALDFGVKRLKDIAFERAVEGELVPVFVAGKLMGFRRKHNDALLMFCLRHYGEDAQGKRTTINYFSTRASAGVVSGTVLQTEGTPSTSLGRAPPPPASRAVPLPQQAEGGLAEASTTTVRTVINAPGSAADLDGAAGVLEGFAGVVLDGEAQAAIAAALEACAARARAAGEASGEELADFGENDPETPFVRLPHNGTPYRGALLPPGEFEEFVPFAEGEPHWVHAGEAVSDYYREVAEQAGMLAPAEPVLSPPGAGRKRRKAG
ncbi:MAG TPA: hypothetical protein VI168_12870 [Croceibacterium sp.]